MRAVYLLLVLQLRWLAGKDVSTLVGASNGTALVLLAGTEVSSYNTVQDRVEVRTLKKISEATSIVSQTVKALADTITDEGLKKFQHTLKNFGAALGIAGALLSIFLPDNTRIQLDQIQKKLEHIDGRLTSLSNQIDGLSTQMQFQHALTRVNGYLTGLVSAGIAFDSYTHNPNSAANKDTIKQHYTDKSLLYQNINGAYSNLNGVIVKPDIFEEIYRATRGDWYSIQSMYMHIQPMLVKSIATYTLGCELKGESDCEKTGTSLMGVNQIHQTTLDNNLNKALEKCRKNHVANRKADVLELIEKKSNYYNFMLADAIANFVRKKYFWKDQTVLVYKGTVDGWNDKHFGDGSFIHNIRNRNVMILEGDTVPNTFSPTKSTPAKVTEFDGITSVPSLLGNQQPSWYKDVWAITMRNMLSNSLKEKGFKSTQIHVLLKNKQVCNVDFTEEDSSLGWNLGKNGKMIVAGKTEQERCGWGRWHYSKSGKVDFYMFLQLKDREFGNWVTENKDISIIFINYFDHAYNQKYIIEKAILS